MKRIGLVGESPNDTISFKNLLSRYYKYQFILLGKNIRGSQLDSPQFFRIIKLEAQSNKIDGVIVIRDLDSLASNTNQYKLRLNWANSVHNFLNLKHNFFILNITMLESLILADIDSFNSIFKVKLSYTKNPEFELNPKRFLKDKTSQNNRTYSENDAPEIFKKIDINKIRNCNSFKKFLTEFERK